MDIDIARTCPQCGERPATTNVAWWLALPLMVLPGGGTSEKLCRDCASGWNFLGALSLIVIATVGFILAVIVW
ncbi:MAG: hypothetical protein ABI866_01395 [Dokdonella sp.]